MKKLVGLMGLIFLSITSFSQGNAGLDTEFASYMIQTERRTIFAQNMQLSDEETLLFWDLYDQFESDLMVVRENAIGNLKKYGEQFSNLSNEQAGEIMKTSFANDSKRLSIRKKYYQKIAKEINPKVATRFMQLDEIVSMTLKLSIYDELPLVGDK